MVGRDESMEKEEGLVAMSDVSIGSSPATAEAHSSNGSLRKARMSDNRVKEEGNRKSSEKVTTSTDGRHTPCHIAIEISSISQRPAVCYKHNI